MTRRWNTLPILLFASVLLCLVTTPLYARTRRPATHAPSRKPTTTAKKAHERERTRKHEAPKTTTAHARGKHRGRQVEEVAEPVTHYPIKAKRRRQVPQREREIAVVAPKPAPIERVAPPAPVHATREADVHTTGISHPPDFNDVDPNTDTATVAPATASVASVVRAEPPPPVFDRDDASAEAQPVLFNKFGRLMMPPPLKGSHEILLHQNEMADRDGLERIQDDRDLDAMRARRALVSLPVSAALVVDERLPVNRRYARPWVAQFLATMSRAHYARFHEPLQVNSAVRTVDFQLRLIRTNGNAAPAEGETASPHLTGQAIDIAKHGLSMTEIAWMRGYLLPLIQEGKIDVEEEFQQACFHISVYKKYMPSSSTPRRSIATTRHEGAALAIGIRP